jgi:hypothetical protein
LRDPLLANANRDVGSDEGLKAPPRSVVDAALFQSLAKICQTGARDATPFRREAEHADEQGGTTFTSHHWRGHVITADEDGDTWHGFHLARLAP